MVHAAMIKVAPLLNDSDALIGAILDLIGPDRLPVAYTNWDSVHEKPLGADDCEVV